MPITAIFTTTDTTLTIATTENVLLEKKGDEGNPPILNSGVNDISVGPGVFRLISKQGVRVSTDTQNLHVVTFDKQGGPIELGKILPPGFADNGVIAFLELKSLPLR